MKNFENKLKQVLLDRKISIEEFAQMCGRSKQTIFNQFHKNDFSVSDLEKISQILKVPIIYQYSDESALVEPINTGQQNVQASSNMLDKAFILVDLYKGLYEEAKAMLDSADEKLSKYEGGRKKETGT